MNGNENEIILKQNKVQLCHVMKIFPSISTNGRKVDNNH